MSFNVPSILEIDPSECRFGIVASRYNELFVDKMLQRLLITLEEKGVDIQSNVLVKRVPGANEIPFVADIMAGSGELNCVIALGVVIAGQTPHHEIIANSTAFALQKASLDNTVPIINGIVVTHTLEQAEERCMGTINRGKEFALAAVEMAMMHEEMQSLMDPDDTF